MHDQMDLQASQYIINLFENSKTQSDEVIDTLPGIYSVVDGQGRILKGNRSLAAIFNIEFENLLGKDFKHLFSKKDRIVFQSHLNAGPGRLSPGVEFKMDVVLPTGSVRNYLWCVNVLSSHRPAEDLYSILGRDVTELTEVTVQKTRMQGELSTARTVQECFFLPAHAEFKGGAVAGHYEPANECGGDWWHYTIEGDKVLLWIGDVTGHGVPAALVVSAVHAAVSVIQKSEMSPAHALSILNRTVFLTAKNQLAMTFFVASIDLKTRRCVYASAAHEPAFLIPAGKEAYTIQDLESLQVEPGHALGVSKTCEFKDHTIDLKPGDRLLLFTDGLREVANPAGRKWKNLEFLRRLVPLISTRGTPRELVFSMKQQIDEYRQGADLGDDVTFVAFALD